jgi:uncharacterized metal-binding protein YceD (DUF177 family)
VSDAPEFSRPQRLDTIGAGEMGVDVVAKPAELAALAERFGLLSIETLAASYALRRDAVGVVATGRVSATATQACVATGEPVPAAIEEDFALRFLPEGGEQGEEVELSTDALDTMFYTGGAIDLGEAAAETFALALDPFPRSPAAAAVLKAAGVKSEDEVKPAGALAGLMDLLGRG